MDKFSSISAIKDAIAGEHIVAHLMYISSQ